MRLVGCWGRRLNVRLCLCELRMVCGWLVFCVWIGLVVVVGW